MLSWLYDQGLTSARLRLIALSFGLMFVAMGGVPLACNKTTKAETDYKEHLRTLIERGVATRGRITKIETRRGRSSSPRPDKFFYAFTVKGQSFVGETTAEGTGVAPQGLGPFSPSPNTEVYIKYLPENPSVSTINPEGQLQRFRSERAFYVVCIGVGVVMLAATAWVAIKSPLHRD